MTWRGGVYNIGLGKGAGGAVRGGGRGMGARGADAAAVSRTMWSGRKRGRASGKVAAVKVQESPSESR